MKVFFGVHRYIEVGHLSRHQHHIFWESFLVKMVDLGKLVLFMLMSQFGEDPYLTRNPVPSSYVLSGVHVFISWFYPKIFYIKSGWNLDKKLASKNSWWNSDKVGKITIYLFRFYPDFFQKLNFYPNYMHIYPDFMWMKIR